jgi:hypothetical protein
MIIKIKYSGRLRNKTEAAVRNEVLYRSSATTLRVNTSAMHEHWIQPTF